MADQLTLPINLLAEMPTKGNAVDSTEDKDKAAAEAAALAKAAADKEAKEKADKAEKEKAEKEKKSDVSKKDKDTDEDELSDEDIQAKLNELAEIEEDKLSDEDKQFIQKYTRGEEVPEIEATKSVLEETYGVKLENKYENSIDGLKQLTSDIVPKVAENMFIEAMGQVPHLKEFYEHVTSGRSIATFLAKNEEPDFQKISVKSYTDLEGTEKTNAINSLKELVKLDLVAKGNSPEDTQALLDLYEANNTLYERGKQAKESLTKAHKASVEAKIKLEEERIKKVEQDALNEIKELTSIIDKNNIVGLSIPDIDLKPFKEALFKPIDNKGNTKLDILREKLTLEQRGFIDYIIFKQFKLPTFKKAEVGKSFSFSKKSKDNDKRVGSKFFGSETRDDNKKSTSPKIDMNQVDYTQLMKAVG